MNTYPFQINIKAASANEASRKVNAMLPIIDNLSAEQIEKVSRLIKLHPEKLAQYLSMLGT